MYPVVTKGIYINFVEPQRLTRSVRSALSVKSLPSEVQDLVHSSTSEAIRLTRALTRLTPNTELVHSKRRWGLIPHALRDDVDMVKAKLAELDESKAGRQEWKDHRLTELADRRDVRMFSFNSCS